MSGPGFTGSPLDRVEAIRTDPEATARLAQDPRALLLELADYSPTVSAEGALTWSPLAGVGPEDLLLLGLIDGIPRFARIDPDAVGARRTPALMELIDCLPAGEAGTYAAARSVLDWHARHRFCANCGWLTEPYRAGWARKCPNCSAEHFPRTDPVVIMLAEHDSRVLVGRQPSFAPGRYSALAGFVEPGESIEEAVARELREEAGVVATRIRYLASQPWPFPSQLMIACIADVADPTISLDTTELEHAKWVGPDDVAAALAGDPAAGFTAPPRYAIAHTLFRRWLSARQRAAPPLPR